MPRLDADDPHADAGRIVQTLGNEPAAIVAASYGGIAGLLAAGAPGAIARALVLFEPACFSLARGRPAVESHVAAMAPVFDVADDSSVSDEEFSRRFATGMGIEGPPLTSDQIAATVPRLRAMPAPWSVPLDAEVVGRIPTLVVTGAWNELYEEVASALASLGARHLVLKGHGHRPQDHPDANTVIDQHLAAASELP